MYRPLELEPSSTMRKMEKHCSQIPRATHCLSTALPLSTLEAKLKLVPPLLGITPKKNFVSLKHFIIIFVVFLFYLIPSWQKIRYWCARILWFIGHCLCYLHQVYHFTSWWCIVFHARWFFHRCAPKGKYSFIFFFVFLNFFVLIDCNRSTSWELHHLLESPTNLSPPRKIHGALPSPFKELKYHNIAYFWSIIYCLFIYYIFIYFFDSPQVQKVYAQSKCTVVILREGGIREYLAYVDRVFNLFFRFIFFIFLILKQLFF